MRTVDLIRMKRDGAALSGDDIREFVRAYTDGLVGDDQMAAFAMAVFFRGMTTHETAALTDAMMRSGNTVQLSNIAGVKVDKHSTGGVGDKVSICLAPLVAACGVCVPMISGRGLGHTGGTLDKLCAIPGFRVDFDDAGFAALVRKNGCALIGQTATLAPADRKLYALRDVTATVESIPLIVASIMSKKLAEGIDALVLDVKVGSGAFMKTLDDARRLADAMIDVGSSMGKSVRALLTSMDDVLGRAVGNANETWEAIEILKGTGPADLLDLTVELGAEMLVLGRVQTTIDDGRAAIRKAIRGGAGLERFRNVVAAQGGDPRALDRRNGLPVAQHEREIAIDSEGIVSEIDVEAVGRSAMILGAGRAKSSDTIDPAVGLEMQVRRGDKVVRGQPIARVAYNDPNKFATMEPVLRSALRLGTTSPSPIPLIRERRPVIS